MREQEKILELINKAIDGTASADEKQALQDQLDREPDVRHLYDEFLKVSNALRGMPRVEPPAGLRERILDAVPTSVMPHPGPMATIFGWLGVSHLFAERRSAYRFAGVAVVVGMLVIAFVLGLAIRSDGFDVSKVYGTIAERTLLDRATPIDRADFSAEGVSGSAKLSRDGNLLLIDLNTTAEHSSALEFSFDRNVIEISGFRQLDGTAPSMNSTMSTVTLTLNGQSRSVIVFSQKTSGRVSVRLTIHRDNETVCERSLVAGTN